MISVTVVGSRLTSARVVEAATEMFERFTQGDKKAIHPNLRGSVYSIVLRNGGQTEVRDKRISCLCGRAR